MSLESNKDLKGLYESDIKYSINFCKPIALTIGLWPLNIQNSLSHKVIKFIICFLAVSFMMFRFVSNILFTVFYAKRLSHRIQLIGIIGYQAIVLIKYFILFIRGEKIEKCFKSVREDWYRIENEEQREVMLKNAQFGRRLTVGCMVFMYMGGVAYNIIKPLTSPSIITHRNISVKPIPSPTYGKFLTSGVSPVYEIVFTAQVLIGYILYSVTITAFNLVTALTMHACGQFEIITLYFNQLVDGSKDTVHEKFIFIVNSHSRVLSYISTLESTFREVCFTEVMGGLFILCSTGYTVITGIKQNNFTHMLTYTWFSLSCLFIIFIYCYIGECLIYQAKKVEEKSYSIEWYKLPKRTSKDLLLFIRCAQCTCQLTAGKIIILCMTSYATVIKSAGAYCNALWNMTE